ncbi:MAG: glycosyltransferase family 8 protein [Clostridia bacterium]|nr:glycosyltransferase family 8 protein [Clostridia bacterium]
MNILVSLDSNYIYPLCVMFRSLAKTNPHGHFDIYVAYSSLTEDDFSRMESALAGTDALIHRVPVDDKIFEGAPVLGRLSKETYYRLLIGDILPESVDRLLYLDPDIVINGNLEGFYNLDMQGKTVAAGTHLFGFMKKINLARLGMKKSSSYVNAGVLLIDLDMWRKTVTLGQIFEFITANIKKLFLADQDVINVMFEDSMLCIDERLYNLDEKTFSVYSYTGAGKKKIDLDWVRSNTVIIHFNGKHKPWREKNYRGRLGEFFEENKDI